jgi:hypothetical protein
LDALSPKGMPWRQAVQKALTDMKADINQALGR